MAALLAFAAACCSAQCIAPVAVKMRIVEVPRGPKMAVWFPESDCGRLPLVLFSHGFNGCGTQSIFLTEELARAGYVVAAPDHRDAACSVDGPRLPRFHLPRLPFTNPARWKDSTYIDRSADLKKTLDWLLASPDFSARIDASRIGAAGHSLGGYTVLGLAGAWESWRDPRIRAALAMAPYVKPYLAHGTLTHVGVPVMYQGAQFDWGITPSLQGAHGAFEESASPKFYVELNRGSHFEWTNAVCWGHREVRDCVDKRANARLIVDYAVAFFDEYLRGQSGGLDALNGRGLRTYLHSTGRGLAAGN